MPVGPIVGADGTTPAGVRYGKTGEQLMGQAHGKYFEATHRGNSFTAADQGVGVAVGTALGTTAMLSLYNPPGSGKRYAIQRVSLAYFSGTLGAGAVYHCGNGTVNQTAPSGGTALTPACTDIGNQAVSTAQAKTGSTVVQPTILRPVVSLTAELATTANQLTDIVEDLDGEFVVEPGCTYQIQAVAAAGTSPKVSIGVCWEEIPIV